MVAHDSRNGWYVISTDPDWPVPRVEILREAYMKAFDEAIRNLRDAIEGERRVRRSNKMRELNS
jgi:hypothetical protein